MSTPDSSNRTSGEAGAGLATRAVRSGAVVAVGRVLQGIVSLLAVVVLARILTPTDFGVFAMVLPVALIASMTANAGLHTAVMHAEELSQAQLSRLFWKAQRFNVLLFGSIALGAPLLAQVYKEPRVTEVAWLWLLGLIFQALAAFPEALLKRELRFGALALVELAGLIVGAAAAITVARTIAHNLALVTQVVVWQLIRCIGAYRIAAWRPSALKRGSAHDEEVERLLKYGREFGGARAILWLGRQFDRVVVGYVSGAASLGLYDSARRWSWYPFQELFLALTDVAVSSLSRARHDVERFRAFCRRGFAAFLMLPLAAIAFVAIDAELVVRVLLGPRWLEAVPMMRVMCGAAFLDALSRLMTWLYTAEGRTEQQLRWTVVSTVVTVVAVLVAARFGMAALTWAFAGATAALTVPSVWYGLRGSRLTVGDFGSAVWRPIAAALGAAAMAHWLNPRMGGAWPDAVTLALHVAVFIAIYAGLWRVMPGGGEATRELAQAARAVVVR